MGMWSQRASIYKVTLLFNYFIFLVYALAFCIPTWWGIGYFKGLWVGCLGTDTAKMTNCTKNAFGDNSPDNGGWMDGVRGVWIGGMACYLLAVLYSLIQNCCGDPDSRDYGFTGVMTMLAGLCGAAGVIVVAIEVEINVTNNEFPPAAKQYYWGYMLACIASGLALILALILLITCNIRTNDKASASRTADYVFNQTPANPYGPEYTNHAFNRDEIPLANGVTHKHVPVNNPYSMYGNGNGAQHPRNGAPYPSYVGNGYEITRPNQRNSYAESADLSNGYTTELIQAEHTLSRSNLNLAGNYARNDTRADYVTNGNKRY